MFTFVYLPYNISVLVEKLELQKNTGKLFHYLYSNLTVILLKRFMLRQPIVYLNSRLGIGSQNFNSIRSGNFGEFWLTSLAWIYQNSCFDKFKSHRYTVKIIIFFYTAYILSQLRHILKCLIFLKCSEPTLNTMHTIVLYTTVCQ